MIKNKLKQDLFDKIKNNSHIVIFGAGEIGEKIFNDIKKEKSNVKILGFVDNYKTGYFLDLPIWSIKEFIDLKLDVDLVVMSTRTNENIINNIFSLYKYSLLPHTEFLHYYYRKSTDVLNFEKYLKVLKMLSDSTDKDLYKMLYGVRVHAINKDILSRYYNTHYFDISNAETVIEKQYLEYLNKDAIEVVYDLGMNSGLNVIALNKLLPNLKRTYGFEAIYNQAKVDYIEDFIINDKLEIVEAAIGKQEGSIQFWVNTKSSYSSFSEEISTKNLNLDRSHWEQITVNMTSIDAFSKKNHIIPSLIKMDIEGAELSALEGGIGTIKKCRPQLAISIYHSDEDFINIPLFLNDILENYKFKIGHYHPSLCETILYAIPEELV